MSVSDREVVIADLSVAVIKAKIDIHSKTVDLFGPGVWVLSDIDYESVIDTKPEYAVFYPLKSFARRFKFDYERMVEIAEQDNTRFVTAAVAFSEKTEKSQPVGDIVITYHHMVETVHYFSHDTSSKRRKKNTK